MDFTINEYDVGHLTKNVQDTARNLLHFTNNGFTAAKVKIRYLLEDILHSLDVLSFIGPIGEASSFQLTTLAQVLDCKHLNHKQVNTLTQNVENRLSQRVKCSASSEKQSILLHHQLHDYIETFLKWEVRSGLDSHKVSTGQSCQMAPPSPHVIIDDNRSFNNKMGQLQQETQIDVINDYITPIDRYVKIASSAPAILCRATSRCVHNLRRKSKTVKYSKDGESREGFLSPICSAEPCQFMFKTPLDLYLSPFPEEYDENESYFLQNVEVPILDDLSVEFIKSNNGDFRLVGSGVYGCVYLARVRGHNDFACVKEFCPESTTVEAAVREAKLLCHLQDEGVVPKLLGVIHNNLNPREISLVQEFYGQGLTLKQRLHNKKLRWSDVEVLKLLTDITINISKVHDKNVLWNDLKPDNILIDSQNDNKIAFIDFGVATYGRGQRFCVTGETEKYPYLAPEVRDGFPTSFSSDVYSLGYLMNLIVTEYTLQDDTLLKLIQRCLDTRSLVRPSSQEVLEVLQTIK